MQDGSSNLPGSISRKSRSGLGRLFRCEALGSLRNVERYPITLSWNPRW